jgi:amidase
MDRFHVANLDSACAFASWVGSKRTAADEGTLVRVLHSLGALVLCKTNVPMSLMVCLLPPTH